MNQYSSKLDTFLGMDMYNKVMPVTPPADLSLPSALFTPKFLCNRAAAQGPVVGFEPTDNPFLRGLGFFGNMADGLVDGMAQHQSGGLAATFGFIFGLQAFRFAPRLTGTIANTAGNAAIVGTGTLFTQECCPSMFLVWTDNSNNIRTGQVLSVTDDTHLTLTAITLNTASSMFAGIDTTARIAFPQVLGAFATQQSILKLQVPTLNTVYPFDFFIADMSKVRPIRGKVSVSVAGVASGNSVLMTGVGTKFLTDVTIGQHIRYPSGAGFVTVTVISIESDTSLTLNTATATAGLPVVANNISLSNSAAVAAISSGFNLDSFMGVRISLLEPLNFYTVTIDPAFATRLISFHAVTNIEHTIANTKQLIS